METDENGHVGPIKLGRAYKNKSYKYPHETLIEFLKVDASDKEAVRKFCNDYKIIPRNLEEGWSKGFLEEQNRVKRVLDAFEQKRLTADELDILNAEIKHIHKELRFFKKETSEKLMDVLVYRSPVASVWEDLKDYMLSTSLIIKCPYCGKYDLKERSRMTKKYCSTICQMRMRDFRKSERKKKAKKVSTR